MRAVVMHRRGPPGEALRYEEAWPAPVREPGQVLIEVAAASVNAGDWKIRKGAFPVPLKLPQILGEDVAGIVLEAPEGSKFKKGDRVFAETGQALKSVLGTYASLVAADEATVCLVPQNVSLQDAAAVPMAGMTAWQALAPAMPLGGKRVLVHAGAGGVGGFAIQIAKGQGAHVTTTCSGQNVDYVTKTLGADEAIDYTQGPWEAAVKGPSDFVLDLVGGSYEAASLRLLKRGGELVSVGSSGPGRDGVGLAGLVGMLLNAAVRSTLGRLGLGPWYRFVMLKCVASEGLEQLAELMSQGKLKVHLDRVWPLEETAAAHEYCERGHVRGKVGILVKQME